MLRSQACLCILAIKTYIEMSVMEPARNDMRL